MASFFDSSVNIAIVNIVVTRLRARGAVSQKPLIEHFMSTGDTTTAQIIAAIPEQEWDKAIRSVVRG